MVNLSEFFTPWTVFLGALVIVIGAIITLTVIERRLNRKVVRKEEEKDTFFQRQLETSKSQRDPKKSLFILDETARTFFEEKFGMQKGMRYSELADKLRKKRYTRASKFCKRMQEALYSGSGLGGKRMDFLRDEFGALIVEESKRAQEGDVVKKGGRSWGGETNLGVMELFGKKKNIQEQVLEKIEAPKNEKMEAPQKIEEESMTIHLPEFEVEEKVTKEVEKSARDKKVSKAEEKIEREEKELLEKLKTTEGESLEPPQLKVIPFKEEKIEIKRGLGKRKPRKHDSIESLDDLGRLKRKINERRNSWVSQGVAIE